MKLGRISRRYRWLIVVGSVLTETLALWMNGYRIGGNVVVRCRKGHLFTTLWIPGVSLKSVRLGWWRLQRCPVGGHWSIVSPVADDALSESERVGAREHRDLRLP
jgi:hypothetical protein